MSDQTEDREEHADSASPKRKWLLLALVIMVVVYSVGIAVVGGEEALEAIAQAMLLALFGALLLQVLVTLLWPMVHRASLRAVGADLRYREALQVSMSAFTVSHTVPGGGAIGAAVAVERLRRFDVPMPAATASAALTGPVSLTTIAGLGATGIAIAAITGELPDGALVLAVGGAVALSLLVVGIVASMHSPKLGMRVIDLVARLHHKLEDRAEGWRDNWQTVTEHAPTARSTARIFAWSVVKWTADIGALALVFVAFGQTPHITMLLAGFGVSQILAAVPATPGAVGIVESGMVGAFVALGLASGIAVTIAIAYRVLETWLPTVAGIPVLLKGTNDGSS